MTEPQLPSISGPESGPLLRLMSSVGQELGRRALGGGREGWSPYPTTYLVELFGSAAQSLATGHVLASTCDQCGEVLALRGGHRYCCMYDHCLPPA